MLVASAGRVRMQPLRMFKIFVFGGACRYGNGDRQPSKHERRTMTSLFTAYSLRVSALFPVLHLLA